VNNAHTLSAYRSPWLNGTCDDGFVPRRTGGAGRSPSRRRLSSAPRRCRPSHRPRAAPESLTGVPVAWARSPEEPPGFWRCNAPRPLASATNPLHQSVTILWQPSPVGSGRGNFLGAQAPTHRGRGVRAVNRRLLLRGGSRSRSKRVCTRRRLFAVQRHAVALGTRR
jgi:hypothetical protein